MHFFHLFPHVPCFFHPYVSLFSFLNIHFFRVKPLDFPWQLARQKTMEFIDSRLVELVGPWAMGNHMVFSDFSHWFFFGFRNGEVTLIYTDFTILFISRDEIISVMAAESLLKPWPWPVHCFSHYRWWSFHCLHVGLPEGTHPAQLFLRYLVA